VADAAWAVRAPDDATLLNTVRTGDGAAFEVLYKRHVGAVRLLARDLVASPAEADHLVAETFALVLDVTKRGGGPTDAFRPYMLTALRRVAASQVRGQSPLTRSDRQDVPEPGELFVDATVATVETSLIARAFLSLPERWQAVLWHREIERADPAAVAPLFALGPDGVEALGRRASEGLQQAYLRLYVPRVTRPECRPVAERIGGHLRNTLSRRSASMVTEHVASCSECAAAYGELADLGAALRSQVAPVFLGRSTALYLAGITSAAAAGRPLAAVAAGNAGPAGAGPPTAQLVAAQGAGPPRGPSGLRWVAMGAGAVVVAVGAVLALTLTAHRASDVRAHHHAAAAGTSLGIAASAGQPSPSATAARKHVAPSASPSTSPAAPPPTSPAPAPAAQLSAGISVAGPQGRGNFAMVTFTATDTGNAPTGEITASISLPSGSRFLGGGGHFGGQDGWSCQPDGSGATCQHGGISAGAQAQGVIFIMVGGSSCGQPVQLTVTSGAASAGAQSGDIQCSGGGR